MPLSPFNFRNPTRVLFGKRMIEKLGDYLPRDKIYMVCYGGGSIKRNGIYDDVMRALGGRSHEEFSGIEANPDFDTLMKCVERVKGLGAEGVYMLAVGGGSVIDGVKFIAAAALYPGDPWQMVLRGGADVERSLPIATVLTLPAKKLSFMHEILYPEVSVLDPDYMLSLPERQLKNGVVDAFVHVCEQYITVLDDNDCQNRYAEGLLKVLVKNGERIVHDRTDLTARSNVMWAANQALNKLLAQGVLSDWATHKIGHELTANLGLDHGQTLAIVQPRLLEYKLEQKKEKLALLGRNVFGIDCESVEEAAMQTICRIESFYRDTMGVWTRISECECSQERGWIEDVCARFREEHILLGEHRDMTHEDVRAILLRCY